MRASNAYLLVTTPTSVNIYNQNLGLVTQINSSQLSGLSATFNCATVLNETVFLGTQENGVISTSINNPSSFEFMNPDGPSRNSIFAINASTNNLWAVYGDYDLFYNPYPLDYFGISKFTSTGWKNTSYNQLRQSAGNDVASLVNITVNPKKENEVYLSSFHSGLLKVENDLPTLLYNQSNSGLESFVGGNTVRINGTAYDKSGNLWVSNSIVKNGLKVLKTNGQWQSYNLENYFQSVGRFNIGRLIIDKNNTKWMGTRDEGLIAFNENGNVFKKISVGDNTGNLPSSDIRALAIDNDDRVWIGTMKGLRVLSNVDRFLSSGQMTTSAIIIEEEGVARELLYEQFITDIVVDGANNKWVGTVDSGVFMFSPDGQKTLNHFTANNSPLPSNTINDIDINGTSGEVFMATTKGMVSFKGTATKANEDLSNVIVYPNPVRPGFEGTVKISGLLDQCNVKITDIEGSLVYEATSEGGTLEWDTKAFGKYKVASGVYMIFISAKDGGETKVKKVMIIR
jgi:sugar lactone lactonase YvrE